MVPTAGFLWRWQGAFVKLGVLSTVLRRVAHSIPVLRLPFTLGIGLGLACTLSLGLSGCGGGGSGANTSPYRAAFHELAVPVAGNDGTSPSAWPDDLDSDSQGTLWFALNHANEIGHLTRSGSYTGYPVPTKFSAMDGIAVDSTRQTVWVTQTIANHIVRLDIPTGQVTEINVPTLKSEPGDVRIAPDGTVWFGENYLGGAGTGRIARLDPATNQIVELPLPATRGIIDGLQVAADRSVWFVELTDNQIAHYANGQFTEYPLPRSGVLPTNMTLDSAGRVWVTEQTGNAIARFDPSNASWKEFAIPTPRSGPSGIVADAVGNIWFTEFDGNKIGVLPAGAASILDFAIPTSDSGPEDIHLQADGTLWFTERLGNKVGQITVTNLPASK
jgi:virginiamycin B lyase